jgi:hypothetical protein
MPVTIASTVAILPATPRMDTSLSTDCVTRAARHIAGRLWDQVGRPLNAALQDVRDSPIAPTLRRGLDRAEPLLAQVAGACGAEALEVLALMLVVRAVKHCLPTDDDVDSAGIGTSPHPQGFG